MKIEEQLYRIIGNRIRNARQKANLTQDELANFTNLNRTSITNIEYGVQKVQIHTLYAIAAALNKSVAEFLPDSYSLEKPIEEIIEEQKVFNFNGDQEDLRDDERIRIIALLTKE